MDAHAKIAIPARFRHNWEGYSYESKYMLKVHKYYANFDQEHAGKNVWKRVCYKPSSKNTYKEWIKNGQPFSITYTSSHKMYLTPYCLGRMAEFI